MKELVALVASYALAWRASRLAPMGVLRRTADARTRLLRDPAFAITVI
jgi:hypothetical protein